MAAAVMSVETGDILALVSTPSFDPNLFVTGISQKDYNVLREHERTPLFSKALSGTYAPASTFKMMTGLAALKTGLITPEDHFFCRGYTSLGGTTFSLLEAGRDMDKSLSNGLLKNPVMFIFMRSPVKQVSSLSHRWRKLLVLDRLLIYP